MIINHKNREFYTKIIIKILEKIDLAQSNNNIISIWIDSIVSVKNSSAKKVAGKVLLDLFEKSEKGDKNEKKTELKFEICNYDSKFVHLKSNRSRKINKKQKLKKYRIWLGK